MQRQLHPRLAAAVAAVAATSVARERDGSKDAPLLRAQSVVPDDQTEEAYREDRERREEQACDSQDSQTYSSLSSDDYENSERKKQTL